MKKFILMITMCAAFAFSFNALAANTNSLFSANELNVSLGTAYTLGHTKATAFQNPYAINLNAGVQYFVNEYIGVEGELPFYQNKGTSLSEANGGFVLRLPIGRVAPYVGLDYAYNWKGGGSSYIAKAGAELRLFRHLGVFGEYQYRDTSLDTKGSSTIDGGLRYSF